jgi:hypothetical protein
VVAVAGTIATASLSTDEARALTDEVKRDAEALWEKLVRLHEGGAHLALGYSSWGAYFQAEFGQTSKRGEQLLRAGRVIESLRADTDVSSLPANEAQARELASLLDKPAELREVWTVAVETNSKPPTAADIRALVQQRTRKTASAEAKREEQPDRRSSSVTTAKDDIVVRILRDLDQIAPWEITDHQTFSATLKRHADRFAKWDGVEARREGSPAK